MAQASVIAVRAPATVLRAYHELTKPGITLFVGMTAAGGYLVSAGGDVNALSLVALLCATMLMSGGAAALNQLAERDLDARMRRTRGRPLPSGVLSPEAAQNFGWTLSITGALLAATTLPFLTLACLAACHISYVFVYTPMKRTSASCTLVGAIPGALPVLAGSAAASDIASTSALALCGLLFTWQIPHFFAIGWLVREDYASAGFNMLPVTDESGRATARAALLYAIAMQGFAVLVTREAGVGPLGMAVVHTAGTAYVLAALPFLRRRAHAEARRLFFASLIVLPVILAALMLSVLR